MKSPSKAIVLAAGLGTRLRPLTDDIPKALLPCRGVPMLERTLYLLAGWGVNDVLVNAHHLAPQVFEHLRHHTPDGMRIALSFEPMILGTGGALHRAGWFFDDTPFWLLNADVLTNVTPAPLVREYARFKPLAVLFVDYRRGPRTVRVSGGRVECFADRTPGSDGTATFCGLHLVSPDIRRYLPPGCSSIIDAYRAASAQGRAIRAVADSKAYWADVGTPRDYLAAEAGAPAHLAGPAPANAPRVASDPAARVRRLNSIVMPGARLLAGSRLQAAIVGPGVIAGGHLSGLITRLTACPAPGLLKAADRLGWPRDRCFVTHLPPRGSARTFHRLGCANRRAMVIIYSLERAENGLYAAHARRLATLGLAVPRLWYALPSVHALVMEDLGDESLTHYAGTAPRHALLRMYRQVLDMTAKLHTDISQTLRRRPPRLCEPFSNKLCEWEHELFINHFLTGTLRPHRTVLQRLRDDLRELSRRFLRQPAVLLHRDLQSSNVMLRLGRAYMIDFQGMRMGPAMYDVASLLCDPYVDLDADARDALLPCYAARAGIDPAAAQHDFEIAAVQRLLQAIGAFGRLGALPGAGHYRNYTAPALQTMATMLERIDGLDYLHQKAEEWLHTVREKRT